MPESCKKYTDKLIATLAPSGLPSIPALPGQLIESIMSMVDIGTYMPQIPGLLAEAKRTCDQLHKAL
ncbi:hypothetical protein [Streptomyces sp. AN091965]|uniref:hypothetical protein n=1 Tax=Streptomyces sp. AN091965 TaxID=2927803 RepID=UPI001F61D288|nr:hypothetical protein [Streptomyces sp. AN091965]MCI3927800.1 hypothetical protein [Streptomyces sp. AN091965]